MVSLGCARLPSLNEPEVPYSIFVIMGYMMVECLVAVLGIRSFENRALRRSLGWGIAGGG